MVHRRARCGRWTLHLSTCWPFAVGGVIVAVLVAVTPSCDNPNHGFFCQGGTVSAGKLLGAIGLAAAGGAEEGYRLAAKHPRDVWGPARWPDATPPTRPSSAPLPLIGLGTVDAHHVLLLGLSFSR